jgi:hypothetical protein
MTALLSLLCLRLAASHPLIAELRALWRSFLRDLFDASSAPVRLHAARPYRPERHYMRGPGPKWHAKHGSDA